MRLFLAIDFPQKVKDSIYRNGEILKGYIPKGVKWVEKKNLHVTFRFLGEVNDSLHDEILHEIKKVAGSCIPFVMSFLDISIIPNPVRPRLIWHDMRDESTTTAKQLFADIDTTLYDLGFDKEKKPLALHTTLGRVKFARNIDWSNIHDKLIPISEKVDCKELVLFKSQLTSSGPIYSVVEKFKFDKK